MRRSPRLPARRHGPGHGRRWWWEVGHLDRSPSRIAITANEIHIPVGRPVRLELVTGEVIHSSGSSSLGARWISSPARRTSVARSRRAGVYRGQCAEYCGVEHAKMAM